MQEELRRFTDLNERANAWLVAKAYLLLAGVLYIVRSLDAAASDDIPQYLLAPLHIFAAVIIGGYVQARLSALAHEASHHLLFRDKRVNDFVADWLCLFPMFGTIASYRSTHLAHHRHVNATDDPDARRIARFRPRALPRSRGEFLRRWVLPAVVPFGSLRYVASLGGQVNAETQLRQRDTALLLKRVAYYAALATILTLTHAWAWFGLFWMIPLCTVFAPILYLREIAQHAGSPAGVPELASRTFRCGPLVHSLLFPYGLGDHLVHHYYPYIPHRQLSAARDVARRDPAFADAEQVATGLVWPRRPEEASVADFVCGQAAQKSAKPAA